MRAAGVVKADIAPKGGPGLRYIAVSPQIDFFIFDGSPKTLDEDIVTPRAFSVHADLDLPVGQHFDKLNRSELATLIRVEDFGGPMPGQRFLDSLDEKSASSVIDTRQARIRRVNQSITAARSMKPVAIGM